MVICSSFNGQTFLIFIYDMSKKQDRYKEDYLDKDIEELDELDTEKFEKCPNKATS